MRSFDIGREYEIPFDIRKCELKGYKVFNRTPSGECTNYLREIYSASGSNESGFLLSLKDLFGSSPQITCIEVVAEEFLFECRVSGNSNVGVFEYVNNGPGKDRFIFSRFNGSLLVMKLLQNKASEYRTPECLIGGCMRPFSYKRSRSF
jgi:hypothetical protein